MPEYWIIDTETASLGKGVVEIAGIKIDESLSVVDEFSHFVNPEMPIHSGAFAVHGISNADVADAKTMAELFPEGKTIQPYWIGHNCQYDVKVCAPYLVPVATLCTMRLARTYFKEAPNHKLQTLKEFLSLPDEAAHRALGDCKTTLGVLKAVVDKAGVGLATLFERENAPKMITKLTFGKHKGVLITALPEDYKQWLLSLPDLDKDVRYTLNKLKEV